MKTDQDVIIHMDRVSRDIKAWYRIVEQVAEFSQDLPVNLTDAITGLLVIDRRKVEWPMDKGVLMKQVNVLPGSDQIILTSKALRGV